MSIDRHSFSSLLLFSAFSVAPPVSVAPIVASAKFYGRIESDLGLNLFRQIVTIQNLHCPDSLATGKMIVFERIETDAFRGLLGIDSLKGESGFVYLLAIFCMQSKPFFNLAVDYHGSYYCNAHRSREDEILRTAKCGLISVLEQFKIFVSQITTEEGNIISRLISIISNAACKRRMQHCSKNYEVSKYSNKALHQKIQKFLGKDAVKNTGHQAQNCLQEFAKGKIELPPEEGVIKVLEKVIDQFYQSM